jgi:hypothetical protein
MRNFVEFTEAESGRKVAIPAKYVCGVSGVEGGVTKITSYDQEADGTLTFPGVVDVKENQVISTTPYEEIMAQLR